MRFLFIASLAALLIGPSAVNAGCPEGYEYGPESTHSCTVWFNSATYHDWTSLAGASCGPNAHVHTCLVLCECAMASKEDMTCYDQDDELVDPDDAVFCAVPASPVISDWEVSTRGHCWSDSLSATTRAQYCEAYKSGDDPNATFCDGICGALVPSAESVRVEEWCCEVSEEEEEEEEGEEEEEEEEMEETVP